jgi:hypothetical protein
LQAAANTSGGGGGSPPKGKQQRRTAYKPPIQQQAKAKLTINIEDANSQRKQNMVSKAELTPLIEK